MSFFGQTKVNENSSWQVVVRCATKTTMTRKTAKCPTNIRLDSGTVKRLRALRSKHNISASALVRAAIVASLAEWERSGITLGK